MRLLVDVAGLLYRAAYKHGHLSDSKGVKTGIVYGVLRSLEKIVRATAAEELVICWDGGSAKRRAIYPGYKSNRKRDPVFEADFVRQRSILVRMLAHLPVVQVWQPDVEADDSIAVLCKFLRMECVGVVTGDHDLYQLARPPKHTIVTFSGSPAELDLKPSQYLAYTILVGKGSNTLPGIPRVGDKTARALLAEHGTLKAIVKAADKPGGKIGSLIYSDAREIILRNLKLMKLGILLGEDEVRSILDQYKHGRLNRRTNEKKLRRDLLKLGFVSTLARFSSFLVPFRDMERTSNAEAERRAGLPYDLHQEGEEAGGGSTRNESTESEQQQFTKRLRKLAEGTGQGRSQSRRAKGGGETAPGRSAARVGRDDSGGARRQAKAHSPTTNEDHPTYPRVRKVAPPGDAGDSTSGGNPGAVRADPGRAKGARVEARGGRTRKPLARLFESEKVRAKQRSRREHAVFELMAFNDDEGWAWLKQQDESVLRFVSGLSDAILKDKRFSPTAKVLRELQKIRKAYLEEPPDWM